MSGAPTRRTILGGLFSAIAAPAIVRASSLMPINSYIPTLWGDGIHCDSAAINAITRGLAHRIAPSFRGKITDGMFRADELLLREDVSFEKRTLKIDRTLTLGGNCTITLGTLEMPAVAPTGWEFAPLKAAA